MERKALTARSVLASTLLGLDPPVLAVGVLVETAALFGISEGSARTALSRMAAAGEVVADGGRYRLTGRLLDRQRRQDEGRRPGLRRWNGRWRMAIVTGGRRSAADRAELRTALTRLRLAEWREGVWLRPDNLDLDPAGVAAEHCSWLVADLDGGPPALWDLDGWATGARALLAELAANPLADTSALAPGFVTSAAVLRHLAADPLLPKALLPDRWPGDELRSTYEQWDASYRRLLATWHRSRHG
ncbi:MAG TPA: PaaX family transcriptional regulator C-terminal domain-containing protein [Acidimicrobiales bacterium]|nr:PaaX family transcriptional regulator C-terminal domain-containing protein [Acidimicrobiales bacterium]